MYRLVFFVHPISAPDEQICAIERGIWACSEPEIEAHGNLLEAFGVQHCES